MGVGRCSGSSSLFLGLAFFELLPGFLPHPLPKPVSPFSFLTFLVIFTCPFLDHFHPFSKHCFQTPFKMFLIREHPALPMTDFQTMSNSHLTCCVLESPISLKLAFLVTGVYLSQTHFPIPGFSLLVVAILFYKCWGFPPWLLICPNPMLIRSLHWSVTRVYMSLSVIRTRGVLKS